MRGERGEADSTLWVVFQGFVYNKDCQFASKEAHAAIRIKLTF
jgi:hypothetical protein